MTGEQMIEVGIKQNVSRLDVSMQDAALVRVMNSARQLRDEFRCAPDRHRFAPGNFIDRSAFDQFHAEIAGTLGLSDFLNGNDARMIETGRGFGFEVEPLQMRFGCPLTKSDDLQRDGTVETLLPRPIYQALSAAAYFLQEFVVAKVGHGFGSARCLSSLRRNIGINRFNVFSGAPTSRD